LEPPNAPAQFLIFCLHGNRVGSGGPWREPIAPKDDATMPLKKGSKIKKRTPQFLRTRADSELKIETQQQILIDLESDKFKDALPSLIIASNKHIYGDPSNPEDQKLVRAVADKIRRLRERKAEDPKEYW